MTDDEQNIRMQCLELAVRLRPFSLAAPSEIPSQDVLKAAQEFAEFVSINKA